jgi:hypothetical protein
MSRLTLLLSGCLVLAGCATGYGSGQGNYPDGSYYPGGYGDQYGGQYGSQRFIATVEGVDARNGRLLLGVDGGRSRIEVLFDNRTRLYYQGRQYPMAGLERGDGISVDAVQSGGRWYATQVEVVRNVRDSGGYRY